MKSRHELALQSWKDVAKFFRRIEKNSPDLSRVMLELIGNIHSAKLDDRLFATTSHEMLLVSTSHRHDARVPKLRVEVTGANIVFEVFDANENLIQSETYLSASEWCIIASYFNNLIPDE